MKGKREKSLQEKYWWIWWVNAGISFIALVISVIALLSKLQ